LKISFENQRGAALVEFAIVLPLLLLLVFGIIEFGFLLYDQAVITNASREGARKGVVTAVSYGTDSVITEAINTATSNSSNVISLNPPSLPPSCSSNPCAKADNLDGNFNSRSRLAVTVYYNFGSLFLKPIIGDKLLQATTVMTYE
jgi:Flp pilus assembly protein TadG